MMSQRELPDPFHVVATALGCSRSSLSSDSSMYRDHGWDSFGHVSIIKALEEAYGICISDDEIEKYTSMSAINRLYEEIRGT